MALKSELNAATKEVKAAFPELERLIAAIAPIEGNEYQRWMHIADDAPAIQQYLLTLRHDTELAVQYMTQLQSAMGMMDDERVRTLYQSSLNQLEAMTIHLREALNNPVPLREFEKEGCAALSGDEVAAIAQSTRDISRHLYQITEELMGRSVMARLTMNVESSPTQQSDALLVQLSTHLQQEKEAAGKAA